MMKNNFGILMIIIILIGSIFSSYKLYDSSRFQAFMMADFNMGKYNTPYEIYGMKLDDNYPNVSLTSLPMKFLKARYFLELDSLDQAKKLLFSSIKANPYIKGPETLLSQLYFKEEKYDSALYFAKDAFYTLPDVNAHRHSYFTALKYFKDTLELENAFERIKKSTNPEHWYEYFVTRLDLVGKNDSKLLILLDEFKEKFPNYDITKIEDMGKLVTAGAEEYSLSYLIAETAVQEFENKNYSMAAEFYENAIKLNYYEHTFHENAGLAYSLNKEYEKAFAKYDEVIYNVKSRNGKSEYLKGILKMQLNDKLEGCKYLKIAAQKKYIDTGSNVRAGVIYNQFCNSN